MLPPKTALSGIYYRILQRLWKKGGTSPAVLAKELDLSRTITLRMGEQMLREGIVTPREEQWALNPGYGTVLGLYPGTQSVQAVLIDFTGQILGHKEIPLPPRELSLPQTLAAAVNQMEAAHRGSPPLKAVALGLPGIVDPEGLILYQSQPLGIHTPLALQESVGRLLGRPLSAENDANCCCWAEAVLRKESAQKNFLCLLAQLRPISALPAHRAHQFLAVGMGFFLGGKVHYGHRFSSGEFKSILKADDSRKTQFSLPDEVMAKFLESEEVEQAVATEWALHAALLVNTLNLEKLIISWPHETHVEKIISLVRREIQNNWSYATQVDCVVEPPVLGALSPAYGAAAFHLESLFQPKPHHG